MVNVTMLVRNRPHLTRQAIRSLALIQSEYGDMWSGSKGKPAITLFILDDRSDKETSEFLASLPDTPSLEVFRNDQAMGTGPLRNLAIKLSEECFGRGDYLYLSDNDVVFSPGWIQLLIDCYEASWSSGCRVLGGVGHPYHHLGKTLGVCSFNVRYAVHQVNAQPLQSMLLHWEVWDAFGPFCDTPIDRVCQSEDVSFTNRIAEAGLKLGVVSPALVVNTGITNSFGEKIPGWEAVQKECPPGVICG